MMQNKGKIKITISDTAPLYPPRWGGPRRIWNLYGNLSLELFDITYVGLNFGLGKNERYRFKRIRANFKEISSGFPIYYYLWHAGENLFFKDTSLDLFVYLGMRTDWQFRHILNSYDADVVICSHPWAFPCVDDKSVKLFIYDAHNCEYLLMEQILKKHALKSLVLKQVKKIEGDACKKSDLIIVCSEKEKEDFVDLYKIDANKIIIIPNGSNIGKGGNGAPRGDSRNVVSLLPEEKVVIFIGAYYKPNIDAARLIIKKIAADLKEFKFLIAGTVFDAFRKEQIPPNVKFLGWVSDEQLDAALRAADIAINPMFDGSGINIKMLEYMSYGLPIVTTECGARGIETEGRQAFVVSSAGEFSANIKQLFYDEALRARLAEEGRNLVAHKYDWKVISVKLQDAITQRLK
jgi:glycosyltransferase involved in cell wall biosynthesis